jgi:hypothetical protein
VTARSAATGSWRAHLAAGILVFTTTTLILAEISEGIISHEPLTGPAAITCVRRAKRS